ncbi:enoyl-CoA hydratase/isomerase family protein [Mucilaginibacter sp. UR6-11]|uniref:enoyl-CoA hydratase/isomerase family protein n=1 Tax=Mucilaginibacter sp. UR6-11 TaxID=1435644 RepID=UPI001E341B3D|nr:enoyl-CoA hydratase-related protein [Mucilaginibacter sp. UR6-11]MCC8424820.1 enoyl-CoA hydratase-related protein [Mucilaginibacter sp. UR6-11]
MVYQNLLIENKGKIQYLVINRESKLNALNKDTLFELHIALGDALQNNKVGGVIITGAGPKAFVAGADIAEFENLDVEGGKNLAHENQKNIFNIIEGFSKPVIAAINGFALGGGLELALACHIRIASDNAKMGLPEVSLGLIPGYGGTQRLTHLVGRGKALELIMTADMISAAEAYQIGLVNYVVSQDGLMSKAEEIMQKILTKAPLAIAAAITAVNAASNNEVNGFDVEINQFAGCFGTADFKEGVAAFLQKRKANFKGR